MFLYEPITLAQGCMWFIVFFALVGANEFGRLTKWTGLLSFIALPILLTVFVWPNSATGADSSVNDWFHYAKVYSALAGCIIFWILRFFPKAVEAKWPLILPAAILAINIAEACMRDFQVFALGFTEPTLYEGMTMLSGPWNIMNGIAGILNLVTICGFFGIFISKDKTRDMIWPDMIWPWIIAYDLWNYAYTYNCLGDHSFYCGLALLLSCTFAAFFIKKGAWLQHRAQTLAFWCMLAQTLPAFIDTSEFAVKASLNTNALMIVSGLALVSNIGVIGYQIYLMKKNHSNPLTGELYAHTKAYKNVVAKNS